MAKLFIIYVLCVYAFPANTVLLSFIYFILPRRHTGDVDLVE